MTKEQVIATAYGEHYEKYKSRIDKNGYTDIDEVNFGFEPLSIKIEFLNFSQSNKWRPKSLLGIENNNGWIKIESEADLPKTSCRMWVKESEEEAQLIYFTNSFFTPIHKTCTHYQLIEPPKPPIY